MKPGSVLSVQNLSVSYGDARVLNDVSLDIPEGKTFGLLWLNGAGKTTAMRMLCGLLLPSSGEASIAGYNIYNQTEAIKKSIGYMSQKFALYDDLTVKENITFFGGIYGLPRKKIREKREQLISELGLENISNKLVGSLPLGWKQKLSFSVSLLHGPKIVFLDEPTGGVDPITRRQFWDLIYDASESGITIFVTTHYMDEAEYCNRISIMVDGNIAALNSPSNLKKQFNTDSMDDMFYHLARGAKRGD